MAAVVVGIASLMCVALAGVVLTASATRLMGGPRWSRLRDRMSAASEPAVVELGGLTVAATIALAGFAASILSSWLLGKIAHATEPHFDRPLFRWFERRQVDGWSGPWQFITHIGDANQTQIVGLVGAAVLALVWALRGRRWWVPVVLLVVGYGLEKYGQQILKVVVDRGHPPTTMGTWPSGGCARILVVFGLIIFLTLRCSGKADVRRWTAGWSLLAFIVTVEAYARTYNLEHWFTDVLGGLVYGAMLLLTMIGVAFVLDRPSGSNPSSATTGDRGKGVRAKLVRLAPN